MTMIDDTTLIAYVDGELDPQTCTEVEAILATDKAARDKVRALFESTALVRAAFNHALYGSSPEVKIRPPLAPVLPLTPESVKSAHPERRLGLALAASLALLLIGGLAGYHLGGEHTSRGSSDEIARLQAFSHGVDQALSGTTVTWRNPDSGNHGTLMPVRTFQTESGQYCREFEETRMIYGERQLESGIACRRDDGVWQVRMRIYPE